MSDPRPLLLAALLLFSAAAFAQPGVAPLSSTHRITIDATVLNKLGHPVRGLDARDFTVLDNGQPLKIEDFQRSAGPVHVVLVLDMINAGFDGVNWERQQLGQFLAQDGGRLKDSTTIAIMTEFGLKMMSESSLDGNVLLARLKKLDTYLRPVRHSAGYYGVAEVMEMSLSQMAEVVAVESRLPGRKAVLVLSPGWPLMAAAGYKEDGHQRAWVFYTLVTLSNEIREAHVVLYSLSPYELGQSNPNYFRAFLKDVKRSDQAEYPNLALQVLAEHSGGRAITMGRDVLGELNEAMRESGPYYQLTFDEPAADRANEFHQLRVTVDQPDMTVRTVSGYYANPQKPAGKLVSPVDSVPLGIR